MRSTALHRGAVLAALTALPLAVRADVGIQWMQGQPAADGGPAATNFCFLTQVRGRFSGHGETVRLRVVNARWRLDGSSQQNSVSGTARCVARSEFGNAKATRISSEEIGLGTTSPDGAVCKSVTKKAWWGDAITVLTTFGGRPRGGGEYVRVQQSSDPFGPSKLEVHNCQDDGQMDGAVYSFFFGKPQSGSTPVFIGPSGQGTVAQSGEFVSVHNQDVAMAPTMGTMCYFTQIGGHFLGGGDIVSIVPGSDANGQNRWFLQARGGGSFARARCFAKQ